MYDTSQRLSTVYTTNSINIARKKRNKMAFCDKEFDTRCGDDHFCEIPNLQCWPCSRLCNIQHHQQWVEKCKRQCPATYDAIYRKVETTVETVTTMISNVFPETQSTGPQNSTSETFDEARLTWVFLGIVAVLLVLVLLAVLILGSRRLRSRQYQQVAYIFQTLTL